MRALVSLLALWCLSAVARADVVPPTPECPLGARGVRSHSGQWCETSPCTTDHDCTGGAVCAPLRMCVVTSSIAPGGLRPIDSPNTPRVVNLVVGSCAPDAGCNGEEPWPLTAGEIADRTPRCAVATYCVDPSSIPAPAEPAPREPAVEAAATEPVITTEPAAATSSEASPEPSGWACSSGQTNRGGPLAYVALALVAIIARRRRL